MKAKRLFCIIAYDIQDDRKRTKVSKLLEKYGMRINFSVFECMFTEVQFVNIQKNIAGLINNREDTVVYYPTCVNCFTKIVYQPAKKDIEKTIQII